MSRSELAINMPLAHQKVTSSLPRSGLQERRVGVRTGDDNDQHIRDQIADETAIAVSFNGQTHAVMMASPVDLEDFAVGFSITEGIIDQAAEITALDIQAARQGIVLQIRIPESKAERLSSRQRSLSGRSGCGICGLTDLAAALPELTPVTRSAAPSYQAIETAIGHLQQQQAMQQACGSVHGAALCNEAGEIVLLREDVGRHNALDKLIGAALSESDAKRGNPLAQPRFILMSSRASHELINKCVIAGANSLVTISGATSLAIDVATQAELNLLGFLRNGRQLVYA